MIRLLLNELAVNGRKRMVRFLSLTATRLKFFNGCPSLRFFLPRGAIPSVRVDDTGHLIESEAPERAMRVTAWIIYARVNHVPSLMPAVTSTVCKEPFKTTRGAPRLLVRDVFIPSSAANKNSLMTKIAGRYCRFITALRIGVRFILRLTLLSSSRFMQNSWRKLKYEY